MISNRQQQILDTAAGLFAERGFHGVSVHDIGADCGISGPALYKHFHGKDEILSRSLTAISEQLLHTGRERAAETNSEMERLEALVDWHIEFALSHPSLIVIQEREWTNLDSTSQKQVRVLQLAYIDVWVEALLSLRDGITQREARAVVQATFGMLNSTPHSARIDRTQMSELLHTMAIGALLRNTVATRA